MTVRKVCVLGGTGFVGRHLCSELSRRKLQIRVLTRRRERRRDLIVIPSLELVEPDVHSVADLSVQLKGCDAVVNLVGILNERRRPGQDLASVHGELPAKVAEACRYNRIGRLLHMSALGAGSDAPSDYLKYKAEGENAAHLWADQGLHTTSFRQSVMFGPDDSFFNRFAGLLKTVPGPFPLACPDARFSPVYVGDVAAAFADSINERKTWGKHYQLCGPRSFSLKELVEYTASHAGIRKQIIGLNDTLSRLQAKVMGMMPRRPFTYDNYLSLQVDSVCTNDGLAELGVIATDIDAVAPYFLAPLAQRPRYQLLRRLT